MDVSEQPNGPGWWEADNGLWYPPESHPDPEFRRQAAQPVYPGQPSHEMLQPGPQQNLPIPTETTHQQNAARPKMKAKDRVMAGITVVVALLVLGTTYDSLNVADRFAQNQNVGSSEEVIPTQPQDVAESGEFHHRPFSFDELIDHHNLGEIRDQSPTTASKIAVLELLTKVFEDSQTDVYSAMWINEYLLLRDIAMETPVELFAALKYRAAYCQWLGNQPGDSFDPTAVLNYAAGLRMEIEAVAPLFDNGAEVNLDQYLNVLEGVNPYPLPESQMLANGQYGTGC